MKAQDDLNQTVYFIVRVYISNWRPIPLQRDVEIPFSCGNSFDYTSEVEGFIDNEGFDLEYYIGECNEE